MAGWVSPSHRLKNTTRMAARQRWIRVRSVSRTGLPDGSRVAIGPGELLAEDVPQAAELARVRLGLADRDDVPLARQLHLVDELHPAWPAGQHDDAVGERDGLGEIVGDEDHRLAPGQPEREKLALEPELGVRVQ